VAQKASQLQNVRARLAEAAAGVARLREQLDGSSIYARRAGLVVYEEYLGGSPRRKIRVGDRVTASQGIVTIPEVDRMLVEATVTEADLHRIALGQSATIRLEAYPDAVLSGSVVRVGTMARANPDRPIDERRFDVVVAITESSSQLRPEMTARIDVALGDRDSVLLIPINAVFESGGVSVVHVIGPSGTETRPVQLGEATEADVEVIAGLAEGERVGLTDRSGAPTTPGGESATQALPKRINGRGSSGGLGPR
jgi:RND family efflux transporter MFP subunit